SCSLDRILRAQRRLEVVEARIPELARAAHPLREVVERLRLERQEMVPTGDAPAYEARALEEADVFRHRVERDVEGRRHLRHPRIARGELAQDLAARLVGERDQGVVELHGMIFTHKDEYVKAPK